MKYFTEQGENVFGPERLTSNQMCLSVVTQLCLEAQANVVVNEEDDDNDERKNQLHVPCLCYPRL